MWRVASCTGHVLKFVARLYCRKVNDTEKEVPKGKVNMTRDSLGIECRSLRIQSMHIHAG